MSRELWAPCPLQALVSGPELRGPPALPEVSPLSRELVPAWGSSPCLLSLRGRCPWWSDFLIWKPSFLHTLPVSFRVVCFTQEWTYSSPRGKEGPSLLSQRPRPVLEPQPCAQHLPRSLDLRQIHEVSSLEERMLWITGSQVTRMLATAGRPHTSHKGVGTGSSPNGGEIHAAGTSQDSSPSHQIVWPRVSARTAQR